MVARTLLVTGFDPFGGATVNPSWQAVRELDGQPLAGHRVVARELPTVFGESIATLQSLIRTHAPDWVVCVGQAGGRAAIGFERVAINVDDARIPDNAAALPIDLPIVHDGPAAYFSTLPIKAMRAALLAEGIAAEVSQTAGTFVCNHVFYGLMHALAAMPAAGRPRGGFVHVPWLPEQGVPSMPLAVIQRGLALAFETALRHEGRDLRQAAGATH